jgi:homoserine dehydrogenase
LISATGARVTGDTPKMKPIQIGLLGLGTVGRGTYTVLKRNQHEITRRAGRGIEVAAVAARDAGRARAIVGESMPIFTAEELVRRPGIDIVVELIGGLEPARALVLDAIAHGKHVVTANKALLARHGNEIFEAARAEGVMVAFEAAVAGGIPIIKALREGLTANRIEWIAGIINGTSNFILSEMRAKALPFDAVLREAQRLGYAEADPTFDIEGIDAAHKLAILSSIAFGVPIDLDAAHVEGIATLAAADIKYAEQLGYRIKLLGITKRTAHGIELRVHPTLVPMQRLLASVEGAMNAVLIKGDAVGTTLYYGPGAGSEPTASSVIADLVDVTRMHTADPENHVPHLAFQPDAMAAVPWLPIEDTVTSYYFRMRVADQPGVLADIARILADGGISIDALFQREPSEGENQTDIIMLTHDAVERDVIAAIARIESLETVLAPVIRLRQEELS